MNKRNTVLMTILGLLVVPQAFSFGEEFGALHVFCDDLFRVNTAQAAEVVPSVTGSAVEVAEKSVTQSTQILPVVSEVVKKNNYTSYLLGAGAVVGVGYCGYRLNRTYELTHRVKSAWSAIRLFCANTKEAVAYKVRNMFKNALPTYEEHLASSQNVGARLEKEQKQNSSKALQEALQQKQRKITNMLLDNGYGYTISSEVISSLSDGFGSVRYTISCGTQLAAQCGIQFKDGNIDNVKFEVPSHFFNRNHTEGIVTLLKECALLQYEVAKGEASKNKSIEELMSELNNIQLEYLRK